MSITLRESRQSERENLQKIVLSEYRPLDPATDLRWGLLNEEPLEVLGSG